MGDMGDYWRDVRPGMEERSRKKRADNRQSSAQWLRDTGIPFEVKNNGAHLIIENGSVRFDFWPGTGKWWQRLPSSRHEGRGVRPLLARIRKVAPDLIARI